MNKIEQQNSENLILWAGDLVQWHRCPPGKHEVVYAFLVPQDWKKKKGKVGEPDIGCKW